MIRGRIPVVVMRSNDTCFMGVLRSLSLKGADVTPVVFDYPGAPPWLSEYSRHFRNPVVLPNPAQTPRAAVRILRETGERLRERTGERVLIIPSSDTNLMLLADHWSQLGSCYRVIGAKDFSHIRLDCIDKGVCAEQLTRAGVPQPATVACNGRYDIDRAVESIPIPAVYKPAVKDLSQSFYRRHCGAKAVSCMSEEDLRHSLTADLDAGYRLVVQERVEFSSAAEEIPIYVYADKAHEIRMAVTAVKESIHPPPFGTAAVLRLNWQEELLPLARQVARALRWRGPLMIEFIKDRKDGQWKVIEVNGRPWLLIDFFRQSGFDFLGMLIDDIAGRLAPDTPIKVPDWAPGEEPVQVDLIREIGGRRAQRGEAFSPHDIWPDLAKIKGPVSFTYDDPDDPEPGEAMRTYLQQTYDLWVVPPQRGPMPFKQAAGQN